MNMLWECGGDACYINTLCLERAFFAIFGGKHSGAVVK